MKKLMKIAFVAALAGYGVYASQKSEMLSDLALANVEALADNENPMCPNGCLSSGDGCLCHTWYPTNKENS